MHKFSKQVRHTLLFISAAIAVAVSILCIFVSLFDFPFKVDADTLPKEENMLQEVSVSNTTIIDSKNIKISWGKVVNASGYNLYRSIYKNQSYQKVNSKIITSTNYIDSGLKCNSYYFYKVSAVYNQTESKYSEIVELATPNDGSGKPGNYNASPPSKPVRLVFIHHSTGEHWLADEWGGLGLALKNNNYFVSDTNYNWGPNKIGSYTDIGNWWSWFRDKNSPIILKELYENSDKHSKVSYPNIDYSRLDSIPTGENEVIMLKSCYPNSDLSGKPGDRVLAINSNLLKGKDAGSRYHTIANAKGIYIDLLNYFKDHKEKLFIIVTAPPRQNRIYSDNARAFNNWLVNEWLLDYPYKNVFVFDFYNVLTSNGGDNHLSDLKMGAGNHHRLWNGKIQHQIGEPQSNTLAYTNSRNDDHPNAEGNIKATEEFLPLLNVVYNAWKEEQR